MEENQLKKSRSLHIWLWVVQIFLGLSFVAGAGFRGFAPIEMVMENIPWVADVPIWFSKSIAFLEILGGIGLILPSLLRIKPQLTVLSAYGLLLAMVSAIVFHAVRGEYSAIPVNIWLGGLAYFIAWGRSKKAPILPK